MVARIDNQLQLHGQNKKLEKALEQCRLLLRELNHRVKNNLNLVCNLLNLQAVNVKDPCDAKLFAEIKDRVAVLAGFHELLNHSAILSTITAGDFFTAIAARLVRA